MRVLLRLLLRRVSWRMLRMMLRVPLQGVQGRSVRRTGPIRAARIFRCRTRREAFARARARVDSLGRDEGRHGGVLRAGRALRTPWCRRRRSGNPLRHARPGLLCPVRARPQTNACPPSPTGSPRPSTAAWRSGLRLGPVSGLARLDAPPSHGHPTVASGRTRSRLPLRGQHRPEPRPDRDASSTGFPFNAAGPSSRAPGSPGQYTSGGGWAPRAVDPRPRRHRLFDA